MQVPTTPNNIREFDHSSHWVEELLDYVHSFEPTYVDTIAGADESLINQLREFARVEVPPEYEAYARRLGMNAGGLWQNMNIDFRIDRILRFYAGWNREIQEPVNPDTFVIAEQIVGELSIDLRPGHDRAIWRTEAGDFHGYFAASLPRFAIQHAFRWQWTRLSHHIRKFGATMAVEAEAIRHSAATSSREAIETRLSEFGIEPCWFSDHLRLFAVNVSDDVALMFTKVSGPPSFMVGASDAKLAQRIGSRLVEVFGASPL